MRLQVTLALICVLSPKAQALKCYQCIPELFRQCTITQTDCPDQCASMTTVFYTGELPTEIHWKNCSVVGKCVTGSMNLGHRKINSECCNTHLCNWKNPPALPKGSPNGRQCYACVEKDCSGTVQCVGDEDQCVSNTASFGGIRLTMKGCASRSFCTADVSTLLAAGVGGNVSCCSGNLCNGAAGVKLTFLFMLVPLFSSIVFFL